MTPVEKKAEAISMNGGYVDCDKGRVVVIDGIRFENWINTPWEMDPSKFRLVGVLVPAHKLKPDPVTTSIIDVVRGRFDAYDKLTAELEGMRDIYRRRDADACKALARVSALEAALKRISTEHTAYEKAGEYATGVTDGHRCAAQIARDALEALLPIQGKEGGR